MYRNGAGRVTAQFHYIRIKGDKNTCLIYRELVFLNEEGQMNGRWEGVVLNL